MKKLMIALPTFLVILAIASSGCGGGSGSAKSLESSATEAGAKKVSVAEIAKSPKTYDSVIVTTEGNYAVGYCSACFLLKDGVSAVRVEVSETAPLPPESKLNSRMRVTGKIYVVNDSPNIIADKITYL